MTFRHFSCNFMQYKECVVISKFGSSVVRLGKREKA